MKIEVTIYSTEMVKLSKHIFVKELDERQKQFLLLHAQLGHTMICIQDNRIVQIQDLIGSFQVETNIERAAALLAEFNRPKSLKQAKLERKQKCLTNPIL